MALPGKIEPNLLIPGVDTAFKLSGVQVTLCFWGYGNFGHAALCGCLVHRDSKFKPIPSIRDEVI